MPSAPAQPSSRTGLIRIVQQGIGELRPLYRAMRAALLRSRNVPRDYDQLWRRYVAEPRRHIVRAAVDRAAHHRVAALQQAVDQRATAHRVPLSANLAPAAARQIMQRPHGPLGWRYGDLHWPRDRWIKRAFFWQLQEIARKRDRLKLHAKEETGPEGSPRMDPRLRKFAYPIDPDLTADAMTALAADYVVIARGEYFASVGLRDAAKAVDRAAALVAAGEIDEIVAWRWLLSPAHDPKLCPTGICEAIAEFDAGLGPGLYLDDPGPLPQSHVNCWCSLEPAWASEFGGEVPQPGPDYESAVMGLMSDYGVTMLTAA